MKTHQPNDYSNTPEDYSGPRERRQTRMGKQAQVLWVQTAIARLVILVVGVWLTVSGAAGLWIAYSEMAK